MIKQLSKQVFKENINSLIDSNISVKVNGMMDNLKDVTRRLTVERQINQRFVNQLEAIKKTSLS